MFIRVTLLSGEARLVNIMHIKMIGKGLDHQGAKPTSRIFLTGHPASYFDVEETIDTLNERIGLCLK